MVGALQAVTRASWDAGRQLLLLVASPAQPLIDQASPTHGFLFRQAAAILERDGFSPVAALMNEGMDLLIAGSTWADQGWRNGAHFFDPDLENGLRGWPHAVDACELYFGRALQCAWQGDSQKAMFYLGASCHIVQDLSEPHHAAARVLDGHRAFERWARMHYPRFAAEGNGLYGLGQRAAGWAVSNAREAKPWLSSATPWAGPLAWEEAASVLLPLAQRVTAGFLQWAYETLFVTTGADAEKITQQAV